MEETVQAYRPIVQRAGNDLVELLMATDYLRVSDQRLTAYIERKGVGIYYEDIIAYINDHIPYLSYQPTTHTWKISPMLEEEMDECEQIMLSYAELNRKQVIRVSTKELERRMKKLKIDYKKYIRYKILLYMWYGVRCNQQEQEEWVFQRVYGSYGSLHRYVGQVREIIRHIQDPTSPSHQEQTSENRIYRYLQEVGYPVDSKTYKDIREAIYTLVEREEGTYSEKGMTLYYHHQPTPT